MLHRPDSVVHIVWIEDSARPLGGKFPHLMMRSVEAFEIIPAQVSIMLGAIQIPLQPVIKRGVKFTRQPAVVPETTVPLLGKRSGRQKHYAAAYQDSLNNSTHLCSTLLVNNTLESGPPILRLTAN